MEDEPLQHRAVTGTIKSPEHRKPAKNAPRPPKKITATYLHNSGLYYLQRFAASTGQFRRVMQRKIDKSCMFHKEQNREDCIRILDELIQTFQRSGLLNDEGYATGAIRSLRNRGLSTRAIIAKMDMRGISSEITQRTLREIDNDSGENPDLVAALRVARRRRVGPFRTSDSVDDAAKDKALAALARSGFSYNICNRALTMSREEAEALIGSSGW